MHECKDSRDADYAQCRIKMRGTDCTVTQSIPDDGSDFLSDPAGEEELLVELKKHDQIHHNRNEISNHDIDDTIHHAKACGLFPSVNYEDMHTMDLDYDPPVLVNDTSQQQVW